MTKICKKSSAAVVSRQEETSGAAIAPVALLFLIKLSKEAQLSRRGCAMFHVILNISLSQLR